MADSIPPPLLIERGSDRVIARLALPGTRNAIDLATIDELHVLCSELEADPAILIVTGADGVFASGADISQLRDRRAEEALRGINTHAFSRVAALPMPVIAAIDGYALGGGAELAYAADIRIGTPRARLGNPETSLGILAAAGATWRLPAIVGSARAAELLLTGRILDADEALAWGLLSSIHDPEDLVPAAHRIADRIAANDPLATRHTKSALRAAAGSHPQLELELQAELFERPEKAERMTRFLERKKR